MRPYRLGPAGDGCPASASAMGVTTVVTAYLLSAGDRRDPGASEDKTARRRVTAPGEIRISSSGLDVVEDLSPALGVMRDFVFFPG